jgi:hypothetical protein
MDSVHEDDAIWGLEIAAQKNGAWPDPGRACQDERIFLQDFPCALPRLVVVSFLLFV